MMIKILGGMPKRMNVILSDDYMVWYAVSRGPKKPPNQVVGFFISFSFIADYPWKLPNGKFRPKYYHLNRIEWLYCLDIFRD